MIRCCLTRFLLNFQRTFSLTTFVVKYIILLLLLEVNSFFKIFLFFFSEIKYA